ncbi:MAG: dipeptidase [Bacteroidota bacterium]
MKKMLVLLFTLFLLVSGCNQASEDARLIKKADRIHRRALTIDSHTDTPLRLMRPGFVFGERHEVVRDRSRIDLPRMDEGGMDGIWFAIFTGQGERSDSGNLAAKNEAYRIADTISAVIGRYPDRLGLALEAADLEKLVRQNKHAIYIGMENGYPIGQRIDLVDSFYQEGVRYITLCHSFNNDICDSSTDPAGPEHHGLSAFGEEVVRRMNELGIMIDLSHASDESFYDVLKLSANPVIASHSCARALCDNPRNLSDSMLLALAENGGVIQMCILSDYVKEPLPNPARDSAKAAVVEQYGNYYTLDEAGREVFMKAWHKVDDDFPEELATVSDVVDHIDHIVKIAGIDHVGIGTDFDGGGGVNGCSDVSQMGNITLEMVRRGYSEKDIRKIWGGNFLRVMEEVSAI